jgi:delta-aminolevulinic acid dehydratase/porphobilinogen synthase
LNLAWLSGDSVWRSAPRQIDKAFQVTGIIALVGLCKYMQDPADGVWVDTVMNIGEYVVK